MFVIKPDKQNQGDSALLFIPLNSISKLSQNEIKVISHLPKVDGHILHFDTKARNKNWGFVIPLADLEQTILFTYWCAILNNFPRNKDVFTELVKAKHVSWKFNLLSELQEIK